jgi:NAD+ synthase (glutamine-hydrolysing)
MEATDLTVCMHQMNTVTGDIRGNAKKIKDGVIFARNKGAHVSLFPEAAFTGYCCGALFDDPQFVDDNMTAMRDVAKMIFGLDPYHVVIVGFIEMDGYLSNGSLRLYNSVAVINNGVVQVYRKQMLANGTHHEDRKYFEPGTDTRVFDISVVNDNNKVQKFRIGTPICEDIWFTDHDRNIPQEMYGMGAEALFVVNQSYYYEFKQSIRAELLKDISKFMKGVPIWYVNSVGVGDILKNIIIFDGGSMMARNGNILKMLPRFEEHTCVVTKYMRESVLSFDGHNSILDALVFSQRELFTRLGIKKAQVHVSGGLDSAVVTGICKLAMGEDLILISNPSDCNDKSKSFVTELGRNIQSYVHWIPIQQTYEMMLGSRDGFKELPLTGKSAYQAILRSAIGIGETHLYGSGIVATGNHTENVLGWCTFHDIGSVGVHMPIGDRSKLEVVELGHLINRKFGIDVVNKQLLNIDKGFKPAAELPDAGDDPWDYVIMSGICVELIRKNANRNTLSWQFENGALPESSFPINIYNRKDDFYSHLSKAISLKKRSVFKAGQHAPIDITSPKSRGFSNRETIINCYDGYESE